MVGTIADRGNRSGVAWPRRFARGIRAANFGALPKPIPRPQILGHCAKSFVKGSNPAGIDTHRISREVWTRAAIAGSGIEGRPIRLERVSNALVSLRSPR